MLFFTRIVSLGYLYDMCVISWPLEIVFSLILVALTVYSCYLTIILRGIHDGKIQFYQHIAYAQGHGRSSIILLSLLLSLDYGLRICPYFILAQTVVETITCR